LDKLLVIIIEGHKSFSNY